MRLKKGATTWKVKPIWQMRFMLSKVAMISMKILTLVAATCKPTWPVSLKQNKHRTQ